MGEDFLVSGTRKESCLFKEKIIQEERKHVKVIKKLQNTESTDKNQLNLYTLAENNLKRKLRKQFHLH